MAELLTSADVLCLLKGVVYDMGSQKAAAKSLGISPQYLADVLMMRREVSANLSATLGYDRIVRFKPKATETTTGDE